MRVLSRVISQKLNKIPIHHKYPNDWRERFHWIRTSTLACGHVVVVESDFGPPRKCKTKFCKACTAEHGK